VLKRLKDAERDNDRIYAVVRGVGVASDGKAIGVMAPRVEGEELAMRRAYAVAQLPA
jgi:acyl transferase domain-containing protein